MPRSPSVPKYRHHKARNLAVVRVRTPTGHRDIYLGPWNSPESRAEYARVIAEQAANPSAAVTTTVAARLTIDELLVAFLKHAVQHYRKPDGSPTAQVAEYKTIVKPLHALYGHTPAATFGPLALKAVRQTFVEAGNSRGVINSRIGKMRRVFKWAVENELVPVATYTALATVAGLQQGHTEAPDTDPVEPVDPAIVDATLPFLSRHLRGLVQFLRFTGCRPSEAASVRRCDLDTSGAVWIYKPTAHKTKHKGKKRTISVGPKAQEVLKEFFTDTATDYLFSPRRAVEERNAARRAGRKTPFTPSQRKRKPLANPKRPPSERYGRQAILTAIVRACAEAFPPTGDLARNEGESAQKWWARLTAEQRKRVKAWQREHQWFPYQLRHLVATEVRKAHGLEAAQVVLGHSRADVTQTYAERNEALGAKVASAMG